MTSGRVVIALQKPVLALVAAAMQIQGDRNPLSLVNFLSFVHAAPRLHTNPKRTGTRQMNIPATFQPTQATTPIRATAPASAPGVHLVHSAKPVVPRDRLLRLAEVESLVGAKRSTIYQLMKEGKFPKQITVSRRFAAWPESAVLQWVQDRIAGAQEAV